MGKGAYSILRRQLLPVSAAKSSGVLWSDLLGFTIWLLVLSTTQRCKSCLGVVHRARTTGKKEKEKEKEKKKKKKKKRTYTYL